MGETTRGGSIRPRCARLSSYAESLILRLTGKEAAMRFAKITFRVAAIWGVLIMTPLYFMFDLISRNDPPPITHPGFFYRFAGLALAWAIAFFFISSHPV